MLRFTTARASCGVLLTVILAGLIPASARGNTDTWDGGGANNGWTTAANWVGDVSPLPHDILDFSGNQQFNPNNNYSTGTVFDGIIFDAAAAGPFTLTGNGT
jgi:hypothetical protein